MNESPYWVQRDIFTWHGSKVEKRRSKLDYADAQTEQIFAAGRRKMLEMMIFPQQA